MDGSGSAQNEAALTSEPKGEGGERKEEREREALRPAVFREGFLVEGGISAGPPRRVGWGHVEEGRTEQAFI